MLKDSVLQMYNQLKKLPSCGKIGGRPLYYATSEDNVLCAECAEKLKDDVTEDVVAYDINWEDTKLYCKNGHKIESVKEKDSE